MWLCDIRPVGADVGVKQQTSETLLCECPSVISMWCNSVSMRGRMWLPKTKETNYNTSTLSRIQHKLTWHGGRKTDTDRQKETQCTGQRTVEKRFTLFFLECRKSTTHSAFFKEALGVENLKNVASRYVRPSLCSSLTLWGVSRKSWWHPWLLILQSSSKQGGMRIPSPKISASCNGFIMEET